jgi:hypothetical protein
MTLLFVLLMSHFAAASESQAVALYSGYLTQVHCQGRLLISSVGNPALVRKEAYSKEVGCGVLLSPQAAQGRTDLLLKTSTGDQHLILEVHSDRPQAAALEIWLREGASK